MNPYQQEIDIAVRIDDIIDKRRPFVERIKDVEAHLKSLLSIMEQLEALRQEVRMLADNDTVAEAMENLNFSGLLKRFEFQTKLLSQLEKRFDRRTLNIGVVGLMGQGKSTLLKSLSGLSDAEIPAHKGEACTAVRSTIYHDKGSTYAKVTFHDEKSFLEEVVGSYYEELGLEGSRPKKLDDFANKALPPQPSETTKKAMYERLRDYHSYLEKYRDLLKPDSPRTTEVPKEEIRNYVAHQYEANNDFRVLAVREVEIFCTFEKSEVEKIALVDTPGLGDLRVGDEKLMLETLGQRVDVVLFVRRPDSKRYGWEKKDTNLYQTAKQALNDLPKRSFMVLNHMCSGDGIDDNYEGCEKHRETIRSNHIDVVKCMIADCSNPDKAKEVLIELLEYLVKKIEDLDRKYVSSYQKRLDELQQALEDELEKASKVLAGFASEERLFNDLFEKFRKELSNRLEELLSQLRNQSDAVEPHFKAQVDTVLEACQSEEAIPTLEQIKTLRNSEFGGSYKSVYYGSWAKMRAHLSKYFLSLNQGLKQSIEELKFEVTDLFVNLKNGNFGKLIEARDAEFIWMMADLLAESQNQLELGFRNLWESQVSYEGLILRQIRQHFDELLTPDTANTDIPNSANPEPEVFNEEAVVTKLKDLHQKVVNKCKDTLLDNQCLSEPSRVRFFIMEEFVDRIHYAKGMKEEWRIFLDKPEVRSKVWPEFQRIETNKTIQQEWENLVQRAKEINNLQSMQFQ